MDPTLQDNVDSGNLTPSDVAILNGDAGNPYISQQSAYDQIDNGTVSASGSGASYSPPSWLTGFQNLVNTGATTAATVRGAVSNGGAAASPVNPAQPVRANGTAVPQGSLKAYLPMIGAALALLIVAALFLRKR